MIARPTHKSALFTEANRASPVVYASVTYDYAEEPCGCFYRLEDGQTFELNARECQAIEPRWRHLVAA
jgi:hypothetical protein